MPDDRKPILPVLDVTAKQLEPVAAVPLPAGAERPLAPSLPRLKPGAKTRGGEGANGTQSGRIAPLAGTEAGATTLLPVVKKKGPLSPSPSPSRRQPEAKPKRVPARQRVPYIRTALPGPKTEVAIAMDRRYTSPSYTRYLPLAVKRASMCTVEDLDGNRFLDFTAGIAVNNCGHCHPAIVKAIRDQAGKLLHMCGSDYYNQPQADLAGKLCQLFPGKSPTRVFFTNSGAESIEAAFKLARYHTGRQRVISFLGGFHGRTFGALSLTASKIMQRAHFAPLVPEVEHAPYGDISFIRDNMFKKTVPPDEVAAVFVEPLQGEGGYIVPPKEFLPQLRELCDKHKILLVIDEVQSGFGRTGKMFCVEHFGIEPDIMCLAKGIASGLPLGAMVAKESVMDWQQGAHGSTFGGNPVSCRAALASIDLIERKYMKNAQVVGGFLSQGLRELAAKFPKTLGEVRGLGLMIGIDVVSDGEPAPVLRDELIQAAFQNGLLLLGCGEATIRFCPPLCLTKEEAQTGLEILEKVVEIQNSKFKT
ncbi:MAG TPA: acetyl ornithine aminotransferase family protein [Planctomycetota bacterium]|jgi:4-aminobutyrate aminotransferase